MTPIMTAVEFIFRPREAIKFQHIKITIYLLIEHEDHHILSHAIHVS